MTDLLFVIAGHAIGLGLLLGYGASLMVRRRRLLHRPNDPDDALPTGA